MKLYYSLTFLYCFSWLQGIPSLTIWKTDIMLPLRRLVVKACRASRKGWKIPFVFETFDLWCELTFYECNKCFWRVVLHGAFLLVFVTVFFFSYLPRIWWKVFHHFVGFFFSFDRCWWRRAKFVCFHLIFRSNSMKKRSGSLNRSLTIALTR